MNDLNFKYLELAKKNEPEGCICGFCGKENDCADDCGFWYLVPFGYKILKELGEKIKSLPACNDCLMGTPGEHHRMIFGVGDR